MLRLFSPAKINLFLRIVSKRSDGYHNLSSLMQTISLGDTLSIESHTHDYLTCSDPSIPTDKSNLVLKATELFRKKTGLNHFFKIHLIKRIPQEAGLGGGSSNAATTLWACNQLTKSNIPLSLLKHWSQEIGSDIPFFFSHGSAYCTGKGESVYHLPALPSRSLWVIKPNGGVSTPEVYKRVKISNDHNEKLLRRDLEKFLMGFSPCFNDLETPAFEIKPDLLALKNNLMANGYDTVSMSGSGSSFFCFGEGKLPQGSQLQSFSARYVNRCLNSWYDEVNQ